MTPWGGFTTYWSRLFTTLWIPSSDRPLCHFFLSETTMTRGFLAGRPSTLGRTRPLIAFIEPRSVASLTTAPAGLPISVTILATAEPPIAVWHAEQIGCGGTSGGDRSMCCWVGSISDIVETCKTCTAFSKRQIDHPVNPYIAGKCSNQGSYNDVVRSGRS